MKTLILFITLAFSFASCSKCYECNTSTSSIEVCKNTDLYDNVDQGLTVRDNNGEIYVCK